MKRVFIAFCLLSILLSGCSSDKEYVIGYTPGYLGHNLPVTLLIGENGISLHYDGISVNTPIGTFSIDDYSYLNFHRTYVQLINEKNNTKEVFELNRRFDRFEANTQGKTKVVVEEKANSTVVTIKSRTITNYLYREKKAGLKPEFPDVIIPHWIILKAYNIDWSVNNFWDLIQDLIFAIIWLIFACVDLALVILDLLLRFIGFIFIVLWYAISSIFK